jgi:dipeptidyl aminopeptidase/acylaminoacyl peptidase
VAFSSTPLDWDLVEVDLKSGESRPLVASSRYDAWGDWLPDGSGLVYSTNRTGRFEIWSENLRDHSTRAIVTPDAFPEGPSLFLVQSSASPDARSVAYLRIASNERLIYVSAIAGSKPVRLTAGAGLGFENGPVWSPDGRWLLYRGPGSRLMKALASGGTEGKTLATDAANVEGQRSIWLPGGSAVIYQALDGLRQVSADGGPSRLISKEKPLLWDLAPGGRVVHAIIEGDRRAIELASIDLSTGKVTTRRPLGRRPLWPALGYAETLRALRVSPDGTRLMYAILKPEADIWILEDFTPKSRPWWALWRG